MDGLLTLLERYDSRAEIVSLSVDLEAQSRQMISNFRLYRPSRKQSVVF